MPVRVAPRLVVSVEQRSVLERWARSSVLPVRQVVEAKGLVLAVDGVATLQVARRLGVSPDRVRRWRRRFEVDGLSGVGRIAAGRGRKPSLAAGTIAEIVRMTLHERPADGATQWSTRSLAKQLGQPRDDPHGVGRSRVAALAHRDVQTVQRSSL